MQSTTASFYELITETVADFIQNGFDSQERLDAWLERIKQAALREFIPEAELVKQLRETFTTVYQRMIERGGILKFHNGVGQFTLAQVKPKLRTELDRRILASANLIRLNRQEALETTLRRFSGWVTSLPNGGPGATERRPVKNQMRKALASLPFRERRVAVDQGHKFLANLSNILATDGGAVAAVWHQHYTRFPREVHTKERDSRTYAVRGNWALEKGLMKAGKYGYTDAVEQPGELINCRCTYSYEYGIRYLPSDMLTKKGRDELARIDKGSIP